MTERLRVAQIVTRFMAGAGGVALRGALALDPDRYEVVFVIGSGGRLIQEAQAAGFEVVVMNRLRSEIALADDRRAHAELKKFLGTGQFDIVHTHSSKAGALGRLAAHHAEVQRIVHTFHGFPFHDFQSRLRRATYLRIERSLGKVTDAFLAVGPAVAAGTVGRRDFQKAPDDFGEALAQLGRGDVYGVWIGEGPLRARTEQLAAKRGLAGRMLFAGERTDVSALLPGLDVFAMASRYEGLPCAIVEAMAAALPVVATAVNAVPNIVVAGETGLLVPAGRPELLSRALRHLIDNPAVAARLGAAGRAHLGDELTPAALGAVLDEVYQTPPAGLRTAPSAPLGVVTS